MAAIYVKITWGSSFYKSKLEIFMKKTETWCPRTIRHLAECLYILLKSRNTCDRGTMTPELYPTIKLIGYLYELL